MGRAPCCDKASVKKGPWSPEEDAKLKSFIEKHGTGGNWIALPQKIGLKRCGKSCRLRWLNYLRPNIKHGGFSEEEDNFICSLYLSIGSRWSIMAAQLPGRTDNDIKNYWNTRLKKKLLGNKQRKMYQRTARGNTNIFPPPPPHQFQQPPFVFPPPPPPPSPLPLSNTMSYHHRHHHQEEEELPVYGGDQELIMPLMPSLQPSFHDLSAATTSSSSSSSSVSVINSPISSTLLMPTYYCCSLINNNENSFRSLSSSLELMNDDYDNPQKQTTLEYLDDGIFLESILQTT